MKEYFDLKNFRLPKGFRGRGDVYVQFWWICERILFRPSPQFMYSYRAWLLRRFGATIGKGAVIRPTATITYPWKIVLGENVWIGDDVNLYSLGEIVVGSNSVVSQGCYICAADHDYQDINFSIRQRPIRIGSGVWLSARTFVCPGVTIADGVVVGAASVVTKNLDQPGVYAGNPSRKIGDRLKNNLVDGFHHAEL